MKREFSPETKLNLLDKAIFNVTAPTSSLFKVDSFAKLNTHKV
jgi:hypothetical protein